MQQLKEKTYRAVSPPRKNMFIFDRRSGFGLVSIIVAVVAFGAIMVPVTRWLITASNNMDDLGTKLEMQTIIQDKWNTINAEAYDKLTEAITNKGKTWTENIGKDDRYKIKTYFNDEGKYEDASCTDGTPGEGERKCRKVSIQITDTLTGKTQALNLSKIAPESGGSSEGGKGIDWSRCQSLIRSQGSYNPLTPTQATTPEAGYIITTELQIMQQVNNYLATFEVGHAGSTNFGTIRDVQINGTDVPSIFKSISKIITNYESEGMSSKQGVHRIYYKTFAPVNKGDKISMICPCNANRWGTCLEEVTCVTFCPNK